MRRLTRYIISIVPLAMTPALVWVLAEGYVNLGGGEKDILMALPWIVWSVFFAVAFLHASRSAKSWVKAIVRGLVWASGLFAALWLFLWLAAADWLGIRTGG